MNSLTSCCQVKTQNIPVCFPLVGPVSQKCALLESTPGQGQGILKDILHFIVSFWEMRWSQFYHKGSLNFHLNFGQLVGTGVAKTKLGSLQMSIRGSLLCLIVWKTERGRAVTWPKWGICLAGSWDNEALVFLTWGVTDSPTPRYEIWVLAFNARY